MNSGDEKQAYYFNFQKSSDKGVGTNHLIFSRVSTNPKNCVNQLQAGEISYDLSKVHVSTNDSRTSKTYCRENVYYGLNLITAKSRKVYFESYDQMDRFINKIIKLQGFTDRFSQYEKLQNVTSNNPEEDIQRFIARHQNTGMKFLVKPIDLKLGVNLQIKAKEERDLLLECSKSKIKTVKVIDCFDVLEMSYIVIEHSSGKTLRDAILSLGKKFLSEAETRKCLYQILKIFQ